MGHLLGKAQRYVADVKAEVNRSIELDELKKMKTEFEQAARDVRARACRRRSTRRARRSTPLVRLATSGLDGSSAGTAIGGDPLPPPPPVYQATRRRSGA
jgi:sec-independent protein translocase protein TatB